MSGHWHGEWEPWRDHRQPTLLVEDQLCGGLTPWNPDQQVVAETVDDVVPTRTDEAGRESGEFRKLIGEQAMNQGLVHHDFRRRAIDAHRLTLANRCCSTAEQSADPEVT